MAEIGIWFYEGAATGRQKVPQIMRAILDAGGKSIDEAIIEWLPGQTGPVCARAVASAAAPGVGPGGPVRRYMWRTWGGGTSFAPGGYRFRGAAIEDALYYAGLDTSIYLEEVREDRSAAIVVADQLDAALAVAEAGSVRSVVQTLPDDDAPTALVGFDTRER